MSNISSNKLEYCKLRYIVFLLLLEESLYTLRLSTYPLYGATPPKNKQYRTPLDSPYRIDRAHSPARFSNQDHWGKIYSLALSCTQHSADRNRSYILLHPTSWQPNYECHCRYRHPKTSFPLYRQANPSDPFLHSQFVLLIGSSENLTNFFQIQNVFHYGNQLISRMTLSVLCIILSMEKFSFILSLALFPNFDTSICIIFSIPLESAL